MIAGEQLGEFVSDAAGSASDEGSVLGLFHGSSSPMPNLIARRAKRDSAARAGRP